MERRSGKGERKKGRAERSESDEILWAKYLDYCSARLCDVFLGLEEERVFELARQVEKETGASQGSLSFEDIAGLLVERMMGELNLPSFESWVESYQANPEKYEEHLLGLWKTRTEESAPTSM